MAMVLRDRTASPASGEDEQIQALNARAWDLRYDDIPAAHALSTTAFALAGPVDQPRSRQGLADSLRTLSHCNERFGAYPIAIEQAAEALTHYTMLEDQPGQVTALYLLASSYWSLGDYSRALARACESVDLAEQCAAWAAQAKALNIIGLIYQSTNHPIEALRYFQNCLQVNRRVGELRGQADALYNMGEVYLEMGNDDDALAAATESLHLHQEIPYLYDLGMAMALIGQIQALQGDHSAARHVLEQGLTVSETHGNTYGSLLCLLYLGRVAQQEGDHARASGVLLRALALTDLIGAKDERRQCHQLLADIYQHTGDPIRALEHYRHFHTLTEELRDNATMHQLKNLELMHQIAQTRREREFYRLKHDELATEIDERRRVEAELHQRIAEISLLNRVTQLVVQHAGHTTILNQIAHELMTLVDARGISIALFDPGPAAVTVVAANDRVPLSTHIVGATYAIAAVPALAQLLASHKPCTFTEDQVPALFGPLGAHFQAAPQQRIHLFPLLVRSDIIGALMITIDQPAPMLPVLDLRVMETIAGQIAAAIEHTRLFEAEQHARTAAEIASRAKSRFLATMSHEIRTPLTGILGYTQLLKLDPTMPPQRLEYLQRIERAGHHLLSILGDILDLARIEADKLELEEQFVNLPTLLEESVAVFAMAAQQKGIELHLVGNDGDRLAQLPQQVYVDARRLRQVLMNLLGNAIKFTDAGSVICCVGDAPGDERPAVRLADRRCVRFAVRDTGIGIDPVDLPLITNPFHQGGDERRRTGGTGLGLAICAEILRKMGSELRVRSEPGEGSEFWFDLLLSVAG
ncbi:MAG: ATP-binding protein [Roseiflexaceae bacterium]